MIAYVVSERVEYEAGNMHPERMFLWPDGDRTVVRESHLVLLNGRPAETTPLYCRRTCHHVGLRND